MLVLCTGNSCRSILAEALINHLGVGRYRALSAGSKPVGFVHPKAIATLKQHGVSIDEPRSKSWDDFAEQHFDLVITVCDAAAGETCPLFPGNPEKLHWSTPDPAAATGSEADITQAFEAAYEMLRACIERELL
ncbi:MAG: arsenate reductase ArsC [Pseudomonadota bacterium]